MSKRARSLNIGGNNAADRNADHDYTRHLQESAYEAVQRAIRARWLAMDWDMCEQLDDLQKCLQISSHQFDNIRISLKQELDTVQNARAQNPPQARVSRVQNTLGRRIVELPKRQLFTQRELQDKDFAAYEAVERAFRFQKKCFTHPLDQQTIRTLSRLRDLLVILDENYNHILRRVVGISCDKDDDQPVAIPGREPRYRSLFELTYGTIQEWEQRKLKLPQPADRRCSKYEDKDGLSDDDDDDDDGNLLGKSDEEWEPDNDDDGNLLGKSDEEWEPDNDVDEDDDGNLLGKSDEEWEPDNDDDEDDDVNLLGKSDEEWEPDSDDE